MKVRFWGTRGSFAKPGPTTVRYGGNTSCVEVVTDAGTRIVIDCGTGGHGLGQAILAEDEPSKGHMLISHTHWDHIQGIPFFAPFFVPGHEWDLYAPQGFGESLRETLAGQMEYTYFPVTPEAFGASVRYHNLGEGRFTIDDVSISTCYLNHPALTLGFRIEADGATVVYSCDHEPHSRGLAGGELAIDGQDLRHAQFLADADLVIHDAQYVAAEYGDKAGWGHSTVEYAVAVARFAGVGKLALTHHDPMRSDDEIDAVVAAVLANIGGKTAMEIFGAAEGMEIELAGKRDALPTPDQPETARLGRSVAGRQLLLLVADDDELAAKIALAVADETIAMLRAKTSDEGLSLIAQHHPNLIIVDDALAGMRGTAFAYAVRALPHEGADNVPIMILGHGPLPATGMECSAVDWLEAPFSVEYARSRIRTWIMRSELRWVRAAKPSDEAERLAALHSLGILDTPPEETFDRFTRIAAALFDVPVALVSLVDSDRQWFKSCFGTNECETPREMSFCAHAVEARQILVVPDTLNDQRFRDNPLVNGGPRIRFYAGVPLILPGGQCIGTFCVIDIRPRDLSETERGLLRDLAKSVEEELVRWAPAPGMGSSGAALAARA
ncbi:GAF domain-containing protein [Novosphingobium tardum]|uniref:GAF domain-containing protein n=1 Tax=Novosphingobium tardum TaxID=1538021 RepID=A0ABV8RS52_9SPHN